MLFCTREGVRKDLPIYISRLRRTVRFEAGRYETLDPVEIAALERNRFVARIEFVDGGAPGATERVLDAAAQVPLDAYRAYPPDAKPLGDEGDDGEEHADLPGLDDEGDDGE